MSCYRKHDLQGANPKAIAKSPTPLDDNIFLAANPMGFKKIICNSGVRVIVQLLSIEEQFEHRHRHVCVYDNENKYPICPMDPKKIAHLHVTTNDPNARIKHYIITFVERTKSKEYKEIVKKLYDTAEYLKITDKKPHFYIYFYGNRPAINMSISDSRNNITRELRSLIDNYDKTEPFCQTSDVDRNTTIFVIHQSNNQNGPYKFNFTWP